ncbi:unnamed protein product [Arabidopsis halleri]
MKKEERFRGLASLFQFVKSKILRSHMILPWLCVSVSVELIISRYWSSDPKMKTMSKLDSCLPGYGDVEWHILGWVMLRS